LVEYQEIVQLEEMINQVNIVTCIAKYNRRRLYLTAIG
jgi:hypothetical protein